MWKWIPEVLGSLANAWGSTQRYRRDEKAKKAGMDNLKMFILDELDEILEANAMAPSRRRRAIKEVEKSWDKFNDDSIIKG